MHIECFDCGGNLKCEKSIGGVRVYIIEGDGNIKVSDDQYDKFDGCPYRIVCSLDESHHVPDALKIKALDIIRKFEKGD